MKVLLVNPNLSSVLNPKVFPPFAMMILAANIRDKHEVMVLDRNIENTQNYDNLRLAIKEFEPDIIGVTSLTGKGILDCLGIARVAKRKGIAVAWGGTHASLFPEQTLRHKLVDFIVVGEGEITFSKLLEALAEKKPLRDINGLGYKIGQKIIINPERAFIENLDDFPLPAWDLTNIEKYIYSFHGVARKLDMVTSRGCPHRCTFCYNLKFNKRRWRGRSAESIMAELKLLVANYQIDCVRFDDDLFTADKERLKEFCELNKKELKIKWDANCRVNDLTEDFLRYVKKAGCVRLTVGVESGSDRVLNFLKKDITVKQCIKGFALAEKYGIMTSSSIIIGLPTETKEEVRQTITMAKKSKASHVTIGPYIPYPGSELSEYCVREGLIEYPKRIEDWGNFSYVQEKPGVLTRKEINRITIYFRFRDVFNSLKRGEWGILKNFVNLRGLIYLKEMVLVGLGFKN